MVPASSMGSWLKLSPASKRASRAQLLAARGPAARALSAAVLSLRSSMVELGTCRDTLAGTVAIHPMLTISQVSKSFAGHILFEDVSLQVNRGRSHRTRRA